MSQVATAAEPLKVAVIHISYANMSKKRMHQACLARFINLSSSGSIIFSYYFYSSFYLVRVDKIATSRRGYWKTLRDTFRNVENGSSGSL